jgi:tetratricopeptide (TPR) repeat protein
MAFPTESSMLSQSQKRILLGVLVLLLVSGLGVFGYYASRPSAVIPPAIPNNIADCTVQEALSHAREAVLENPRSSEAWGEFGYVFRAHDVFPEASICFTQASRLSPDEARWPYLIGLTNIYLTGNVIPHLREAYRLENGVDRKSAARLRLAEALFDAGEVDEATELFREQLRLSPGEARAHFGLGVAALSRDKFEEAVSELERVVTTPYVHKRASALLAAAHRRLGHPDQVEKYEKQEASGPKDLSWPDPYMAECLARGVGRRALFKKGSDFEAKGQYWEAVAVHEELAQIYHDEPCLIALGKVLALAGGLARSEDVLRDAVKLNEGSVPAHFFLARTLMFQANESWKVLDNVQATRLDEEAIKEFRRCLELKPGHAVAHVNLAQTLQRLGRNAEAIKECREAVGISPQTPESHLALGEVLFKAGKPSEALSPLEEAVRLSSPQDRRANALLEKVKASMKPER